jgi:hypothetical protein
MQTANASTCGTNAATSGSSLVHEAQLVRSYVRYVAFIGLRLLGNRANVVDLVQLGLRHSLGHRKQARDSARQRSSQTGMDELGDE